MVNMDIDQYIFINFPPRNAVYALICLILFSFLWGAQIYAKKIGRINCGSFQTWLEAQTKFEDDMVKYKSLDANRNKIACEKLIRKGLDESSQ